MQALTLVLIDVARSTLYFPIWWYTKGLFNFGKKLLQGVHVVNAQLGFTIWVKNIFTPMYSQTDIVGRMFSFFLRVVNIVIRGVALVSMIGIFTLFLMVWIAAPYLIVRMIVTTLP
jgi:hypothetical protein